MVDVEPETPGCPAGELELADGSCRAAGIAPDECGDGFEHDGDVGCEPILPDEPCAPGMMAIPGETTCREVAPCGDGPWGDIPVDDTTEHVDGSYTGGDSDGSAAKPWTTIQQAVNVAAGGAIVAIAPGTYEEHVFIAGKPVRLWGKCPAEVAIVGPPDAGFVVDIRTSAGGTEVKDLAITGSGLGLAVAGSQDVVGDRLWIHDTSAPGWSVQNFGGETSGRLERSLVENAVDIGAYGVGAALTLRESVVRGSQPVASTFGHGASVWADPQTNTMASLTIERSVIVDNPELAVLVTGSTGYVTDSVLGHTAKTEAGGSAVAAYQHLETGQPSNVTVLRSVVEQSHNFGIYAQDSSLLLEATVVRDVAATVDGANGMGVRTSRDLGELSTFTTLRKTVVERAHACGVCVAGMETLVESVVVRDIALQPLDGLVGRGVSVEGAVVGPVPLMGEGTVRGSVIERTHEAGMTLVFSETTVESTVVRDVEPRSDGTFGRGLSAELDLVTGNPAIATLDGVLVERTHEFGIFVGGSQATITRSHVRDIAARPADGGGGVGIAVQRSFETGGEATATVVDATVERCQQSGLSVLGTSASFENVVVRDALPDGNGAFGDGLVASLLVFDLGEFPATVSMASSRIDNSPRAGLLAFAAEVSLADTHLSCNAFHLNGEVFEGHDFVIVDDGGNSCGCGDAVQTCKVLSSGLDVPAAIP